MRKNEIKNVEWKILIGAIILNLIGLVALFSATQENNYDEFYKQLIWFGVSVIVVIVTIFIDYELLVKCASIFYGSAIILLLAVLFTTPVNGASSWFDIGFFSFQPAEFSKIAVIIFMAYIINKIQLKSKNEINKPLKLLMICGVFAVPVGLIMLQPDNGTALAFIVAMGIMLIISGLNKKYIFGIIVLILISVPLVYNFVLPGYAKERIDIFFNPESDPRGAGYNILQSKLAIGAGGLTGMGLLEGNQTQLGFLHPKTTDFIFSVIGEELGFVISITIVLLYLYLISKCIFISKTAKNDVGMLIGAGFTGVLIFHFIQNIGMVMGLLPITGVPLPFVSYGGSSLITNYIMIGILLNISAKRQKTIFIK